MNLAEFYAAHAAQEETDFRFVALVELLAARLRGRSVVDLGCGTAALARALSGRGLTVLAVEPDPAIHALAAAAPRPPGLTLLNARLEELSAAQLAPYENVLLIDVLEHIADDRAALARIAERMAPGAQLLCLLPAIEGLYGRRDRDVGHHRRYSAGAARRLFEGLPFSSVELSAWNMLGVPVYWLCEKVLGRPVPETIRQGRRGPLQRMLNAGLLAWFRLVENRVSAPAGLSLLVRATRGRAT